MTKYAVIFEMKREEIYQIEAKNKNEAVRKAQQKYEEDMPDDAYDYDISIKVNKNDDYITE